MNIIGCTVTLKRRRPPGSELDIFFRSPKDCVGALEFVSAVYGELRVRWNHRRCLWMELWVSESLHASSDDL